MVEKSHQDRQNEPQDFVCGERDKDKWDDNHVVGGTSEAAFLGPCGVTIVCHGKTVSGLKTGIVPAQISTLQEPGVASVPVVERRPDVSPGSHAAFPDG